MSAGAVYYSMGMGTGKSLCVVAALNIARAERVLIICPSKVVGVWPREFEKHTALNRPWHVVNGMSRNRAGKPIVLPVAKRLQEMESVFFDCLCRKPHAAVINYDALVHSPLKAWRPKKDVLDAIVFDEIHKIKAAGGTQSMWCSSVGKLAKRRLGLSGTMFPQTPLDIYGQFRALDPSIFGTNHRSFMSKYANERTESTYGGAEYKVVESLKNEEDLMTRVRTIAYEVSSDVLDLPDRIPDVTRAGILAPEAAKLYASLESDMWAEVATADGGAEVSVRNVLGKMLRQQQITGGSVPTDDGQVLTVGDTKAKLLAEVLEETGRVNSHDPHSAFEPVVVFARFRHDLKVIREVAAATGRTYAEISGSRRDGLTELGTMNPDVDLVGVQEQSGGTGVDLTRSRFAVYYSLTFSRSDFEQSIFRLDRPGQERSVLPIHLVCAGTIDEQIYAALSARQSVIDYVLSLKGYQVGNDGNVQKIIPTE
jgi:SNF2 family DNA or RNA helicase